jgi:hypothetical protein
MLIQLQPVQISALWHEILDSYVRANEISSKAKAEVGKNLLVDLLSRKRNCWIVYSVQEEERRIHAIGITGITVDNMTGVRELEIFSLYGYRTLTEELSRESFQKFSDYARANQCQVIRAVSGVKRIQQLCDLVGLKPTASVYKLEVEEN